MYKNVKQIYKIHEDSLINDTLTSCVVVTVAKVTLMEIIYKINRVRLIIYIIMHLLAILHFLCIII